MLFTAFSPREFCHRVLLLAQHCFLCRKLATIYYIYTHTFQPNTEVCNEEEFCNVAAVVLYGRGTLFSLQLESLHGMAIYVSADNLLL